MSGAIRKVAVLGSGVMGSGIAAHVANAGLPVLMLDIVPPKAGPGEDTRSSAFRNRFSLAALGNLRKQRPAPLFTAAALELIEAGNFEDDLARIAECDWVVEVVKEDMAVKQALFARVEPHLAPGAAVTSNTSGMSIVGMLEGRGAAFRRSFLVTHFFNPVRYMKLLELVAGKETDPAVVERMARFGEEVLGKGIVYGKDTTNFIANRVGTYGMLRVLAELQKAELTVEEVDKIFGPALGRPKSAVFRTTDIVGLDTFVHVARNCYDTLLQDEERETFRVPAFVEQMVEKGMLGDKSGQGFYKLVRKPDGEKEILALDLATLTYRPQGKVRFESLGAARGIDDVAERIRTVLTGTDKAARFAERVTLDTLAYASRRIPEISDDLVNIDRALRWGFAWDLGPFQVWDVYGVRKGVARMKELGLAPAKWVEEMLAAGRETFYGVEGTRDTAWDIPTRKPRAVPENPRTVKVEYLRRGNRRVETNDSSSLWDMGDGAFLLEFHSKMNALGADAIQMLASAAREARANFDALVVGNQGENFSVGANLMLVLLGVQEEEWDELDVSVRQFQNANMALKYAELPVVAAPFGLALGGGCEISLHATRV
ncbi:MAG TPA: 3-hydroxyacyl-CoA dehydrogenase/enoyl-CoA hydratase family protein, partial [Myxococcaceae bacterium]|nr:3-hydroxyacyl-CoA dehydrogenase/enoyl-CoA hydratase family protein [Myxococcaceae bacterium]